MNELEAQKEEVLKQINDAQSEIEMGEVLGDSGMSAEGIRKKDELNNLLKQIEEQIEELARQEQERNQSAERVNAIREEIANKYSEQYDYFRISSMSDEEVRSMNSEAIQESASRKDSVKATLERYQIRTNELLGQLSTVEQQIEEVKRKFMETHDQSLMAEAKNLADSKKRITEELEVLKQQLEAANIEYESIEDVTIDVDKYKDEELGKLEGKYTTEIGGPTLDFIRQQQAEGKSLSEITQEINAPAQEAKKNESENAYFKTDVFIKYKNLEAMLERLSLRWKIGEDDKKELPLLTERATEFLTSPIADDEIKNVCREILDLINKSLLIQSELEQLNKEIEEYRQRVDTYTYAISPEINAKQQRRDELDKLLENDYIPRLRSAIKVARTICSGKVVRGYEQATGINTEIEPNIEDRIINLEREVEAKRAQQRKLESDYIRVKNSSFRTPQEERLFVEYEAREKEIEQQTEIINKEFYKLGKAYAGTVLPAWYQSEKNTSNNSQTVEIPGSSKEPGEYNEEDVERYIIEQEYLEEQRAKAQDDSKQVQQSLTEPNKELEEMMSEKPELQPQESAVLSY